MENLEKFRNFTNIDFEIINESIICIFGDFKDRNSDTLVVKLVIIDILSKSIIYENDRLDSLLQNIFSSDNSFCVNINNDIYIVKKHLNKNNLRSNFCNSDFFKISISYSKPDTSDYLFINSYTGYLEYKQIKSNGDTPGLLVSSIQKVNNNILVISGELSNETTNLNSKILFFGYSIELNYFFKIDISQNNFLTFPYSVNKSLFNVRINNKNTIFEYDSINFILRKNNLNNKDDCEMCLFDNVSNNYISSDNTMLLKNEMKRKLIEIKNYALSFSSIDDILNCLTKIYNFFNSNSIDLFLRKYYLEFQVNFKTHKALDSLESFLDISSHAELIERTLFIASILYISPNSVICFRDYTYCFETDQLSFTYALKSSLTIYSFVQLSEISSFPTLDVFELYLINTRLRQSKEICFTLNGRSILRSYNLESKLITLNDDNIQSYYISNDDASNLILVYLGDNLVKILESENNKTVYIVLKTSEDISFDRSLTTNLINKIMY